MSEHLSAQAIAQRWRDQSKAKQMGQEQAKDAHGSADWLLPEEELQEGLDQGALFFGRSSRGLLKYGGEGHCLTFGPTGTGKSRSVIVPNVLYYPGSVAIIEPKGAIAAITARRRLAMGQRVYLFDPFGEVERAQGVYPGSRPWAPLPCNRYNPFQALDPQSLDIIEDVRLLASSVIMSETDKNRFFSDSARVVFENLVLFMLANVPRHQWTLDLLLDLAFMDAATFEGNYLPKMQASEAFDGHVRRLANQIAGFSTEGAPAIWSTLRRSLNFLQTPRMSEVMADTDLDFRTLKDQPTTVYLVLPAKRLQTHGAWLRIMIAMILNQISDSRQPQHPVLLLLDECASLGRLDILETAVGLMRGYGIKLWLVWQDLPQLQSVYGNSWGTFISNSGVKQFFNVNDPTTADFVSNYIGNETRRIFQESVQQPGQLAGGSYSYIQRPVITPDELRRLPKHESVLLYEGLKPVRASKLFYDRDPEFQGFADPDPYYVRR